MLQIHKLDNVTHLLSTIIEGQKAIFIFRITKDTLSIFLLFLFINTIIYLSKQLFSRISRARKESRDLITMDINTAIEKKKCLTPRHLKMQKDLNDETEKTINSYF
jgi:hypothetical protein